MEQINISDLRANLLKYLKKAQSGSPFSVTSNGEVLAAIIAPEALKISAKEALDDIAETAKADDIVEPVNAKWNNIQ